ncbi:MAG: hypothetical protein AVDCRST_MAG34-2600 [uncultured Nocardioidaceae bacterium]|uniref:Putative regulatory protein FmdB zinc ribbon domain-containing protein n=1 Tax=uncultured Nocardioidaceae bacterium TaxID=253824 RepID=A0A6J4MLA4_9ACTN|nr:MAG: hypothetical protein AVDCRST_MAG34-2600 [uncultured Nocardioidaceae bacterium]
MPTYQYSCTECGHFFEQFQSFSDDALTTCPECEGRLRKVFNAVGVVFKGSGFYRTDSRAGAGQDRESSGSSEGKDGGGSKDGGTGGGKDGGGGSKDRGKGGGKDGGSTGDKGSAASKPAASGSGGSGSSSGSTSGSAA